MRFVTRSSIGVGHVANKRIQRKAPSYTRPKTCRPPLMRRHVSPNLKDGVLLVTELDEIVRRSLVSFATESLSGGWTGRREREAVSLYVLGHLLREVRPDSVLHHAAQIGIEFPVPQVSRVAATTISGRGGAKTQVCKDIVLWSRPGMTCWDEAGAPTVAPMAILEWKFGVEGAHEPDVAWLSAFAESNPGFVGYAVSANRPGSPFLVEAVRVVANSVERGWLRL